MIRGIIQSVISGAIQRFTASGRHGETIADRELFQQYGHASRPLPGAEVIILTEGNHVVAIATEDRRYRIELAAGEVALYDDLGQKVHLTRTGIVITSPIKVTIDTPLLEVSGEITAGGNITDQTDTTPKTMAGMRSTFDAHTHQYQDLHTDGWHTRTTAVPDQEM